jgi:hypothetical protein
VPLGISVTSTYCIMMHTMMLEKGPIARGYLMHKDRESSLRDSECLAQPTCSVTAPSLVCLRALVSPLAMICFTLNGSIQASVGTCGPRAWARVTPLVAMDL